MKLPISFQLVLGAFLVASYYPSSIDAFVVRPPLGLQIPVSFSPQTKNLGLLHQKQKEQHRRHINVEPLHQSNNNNNNDTFAFELGGGIGGGSEAFSNGLASVLTPWEEFLNDSTDGYALTYADVSPVTESTPVGVGFLATNVAYALTGLLLTIHGDMFFGFLTEIAGIVSFWYHYAQLKHGQLNQQPVKLALMVDYMTAGAALMCTGFYLVTFPQGFQQIPVEALITGIAAVTSLGLCWVWEVGYSYLFWHSLWHLFSAYAGYVVGQAHIAATM